MPSSLKKNIIFILSISKIFYWKCLFGRNMHFRMLFFLNNNLKMFVSNANRKSLTTSNINLLAHSHNKSGIFLQTKQIKKDDISDKSAKNICTSTIYFNYENSTSIDHSPLITLHRSWRSRLVHLCRRIVNNITHIKTHHCAVVSFVVQIVMPGKWWIGVEWECFKGMTSITSKRDVLCKKLFKFTDVYNTFSQT